MSTQDKVYTIEALLEKEGSMFLVKWENYTSLWNSWEPRDGIPPFIVKVILLTIYVCIHCVFQYYEEDLTRLGSPAPSGPEMVSKLFNKIGKFSTYSNIN